MSHRQADSESGMHGIAALQLTPVLEGALCRFITQRTGIVMQGHQVENLRAVVGKACQQHGHASCAQYLASMEADPLVTPELEFLIAGITVGESYFFRDEESMELLREELLPQLIAQKRKTGNLSLRIWSAGCSIGQEIYTLAMMLDGLLPDRESWNLHLLGTDINSESLRHAIRGHYNTWSFRAMPPDVRDKFFAPAGQQFEIKPAMRKHVKFAYLNLTEDSFPSVLSETHSMDLILCRNVFIYLAPQAVQRIMAKFANALVDDGLLLLGSSDLVGWSAPGFEYVPGGKTYYYRRKDQAAAKEIPTTLIASQAPSSRPASTVMDNTSARPGVMAKPDKAHALLRNKSSGNTLAGKAALTGNHAEVIALLRAERWRDALALLARWPEVQPDAGIARYRAVALANLGEMDEALQACATSMALDPTDKHIYLVQGIVFDELDRREEAVAALRKAIYLDHQFLEAHYQLGLLSLRSGQATAGLKSLHNALHIATQGDPERELHNAAGMTYRRFADILRKEIEMYDRRGKTSAQTHRSMNVYPAGEERRRG